MTAQLSEIHVYDFFKDKLSFIEADAKKYARFAVLSENRLYVGIKEYITTELKMKDYVTKHDLLLTKQDLQSSMNQLESRLDAKMLHLEAKMEKNAKEIVLLIVTLLSGIIGLAVAAIKIF